MSFGNRLKLLREENSLSREELANKFNLTYSTISKYETDKRFPDQETLKMIAKFFDVSLDFLMGVSDIRNPYLDEISKEKYKDTIEKLERFRNILIDKGNEEYKYKTLEELADRIILLNLIEQTIKDDKK